MRKAARQAQTRAINSLESAIRERLPKDELRRLVEILKSKVQDLRTLDEAILAETHDESFEEEYVAIGEYRDSATSALFAANSFLGETPSDASSASAASFASSAATSSIALPKLQLPTFSGDSIEWRPFWSQFQAAVHETSIPDVQKLTHLVACLRSSALDAVRGMPIVGDNYSSAVTFLRERFGDPSALIGLYAAKLVSCPSIDDGAVNDYRSMIDTFTASLREIRALSEEVLSKDPTASLQDLILAPLLPLKLPPSSRLEWTRKYSDPARRFDLGELLDFAQKEVDNLRSIAPATPRAVREAKQRPEKAPRSATSALLARQPQVPRIKDLPSHARLGAVRTHRLCFVCFSPRHAASQCSATRCCDLCSSRHHTLLHGLLPERGARTTPSEHEGHEAPDDQHDQTSHNLRASAPAATTTFARTLLQTAVVKASASGSSSISCRLLLDSGSEHSFVTRSLARRLRARRVETKAFAVEGFGGRSTTVEQHDRVEITLRSRMGGRALKFRFWVVDRICSPLPSLPRSTSPLPQRIRELLLADTFASDRLVVDLVAGADCLAQIIESVPPVRAGPYCAWSTVYGWVLSGPAVSSGSCVSGFARVNCFKAGLHDPTSLWDLEAVGISMNDFEPVEWGPPSWNGERYEVKLPWRDESRPCFSKREAEQRLAGFHRLREARKEKYLSTISEWEESGILEASKPSEGSFLPHHSVVQHDRLRVVIDGSAKPRAGHSINDCLSPGPPVQLDLPAVLHRFRSFKFAITADVTKAYLMVSVTPDDRSFLKLLHPDGRVLQFARLPFGLNCSAALLHSVIQHHLARDPDRALSAKIAQGMYVDDLLTGADSERELQAIKGSAKELFQAAGMTLHKFAVSQDHNARDASALGLSWDCASDSLAVCLLPRSGQRISTKRDLLSAAARTFDPLGLASPWLVRYRILVQDAWIGQFGLDDRLPLEITDRIRAMQCEADAIESFRFDRYLPSRPGDHLEAYADASGRVYAACVYIVHHGERKLVLSKFKLAPLHKQKLTVPRLELMAALIATRAVAYLRSVRADLADLRCLFFSDSMIALGWIRGEPTDVFVRNRVKEIRKATDIASWNHVPTCENPADLITRGVTADALISSQKWWNGPSTAFEISPTISLNAEVTRADLCEPFLPTHHWSSWHKARRVTAWILRFLNNCRVRRCKRQMGPLIAANLRRAEQVLLKDAQSGIDTAICDRRLRLTRREDGLIVGELRTGEPSLPFLPNNSALVPLLIRHAHAEIYHQGIASTCAEISRSYLIPGVRRSTKAVLARCVRCRRANSRPFRSDEAALPDFRSTPSRPFERVGIDHFGPLYVAAATKVWILLFTCPVVRAIHMEVVTALDEQETALAIRRFQALRGPISEVYSDNGRSFVALQRAWSERVTWRTIPARSPWWGGWWERMIGTVKRALKTTLSNTHLNQSELRTVVAECAERVNRRPLVSEDGAEGPLTPAHFLYGCAPPPLISQSTPASAEMDASAPLPLGRRWKHRKNVLAHLWERWRSEYLASLRNWTQRPSRYHRTPRVGEIVLCSSRPLPRGRWPMARIVRLLPGRDGEIRAAVVRIGTRESRRAISLLHPLEAAFGSAPNGAAGGSL